MQTTIVKRPYVAPAVVRTLETRCLLPALDYARRGWPVLPVHAATDGGTCSCGKVACKNVAKHPRTARGLKDATTNDETIWRWWLKWPDANVAVVTGASSGLCVLDIDPRNGGDDALAEMERQQGALPDTPQVITGGGGRHVLLQHPGRGAIVRCASGFRPGLDFKADGGYIVAPPSRHASGRLYAWDVAHHPDETALASPPEWLFPLLRNRSSGENVVEVARRRDEGALPLIPHGKRNVTLMSLAGTMRRRGMSGEAIRAALLAENTARCEPPLDDREVAAIATSVANYSREEMQIAPARSTGVDQDQQDHIAIEPFPLVKIADVPDDGPVRYLVRDLWTEQAVGIVGAEAKLLKSFLSTYLGVCIAAGVPAFSDLAVSQGRVLMFNAEDRRQMIRSRVERMCRALGLALRDLDLLVVDVPALRIDDPAQAGRLVATVARAKPRLVILDPLRDLHSLDENDARLAASLLAPLRLMQREHGCAVMVVHHMSKTTDAPRRAGQRLRGSSVFHAWLDSALYLEPADDHMVKVTVEHRGAPAPAPFCFQLRETATPEGAALWLDRVATPDRAPADEAVVLSAVNGAGAKGIGTKALRDALRGKMGRERLDGALKALLKGGVVCRSTSQRFVVASGANNV